MISVLEKLECQSRTNPDNVRIANLKQILWVSDNDFPGGPARGEGGGEEGRTKNLENSFRFFCHLMCKRRREADGGGADDARTAEGVKPKNYWIAQKSS